MRLTLISSCLQKALLTWEVNSVPRSLTISSGRPYTLKTWWNRAWAVSMAVGSPLNGIKRQDLEKRSIMTSMVVKWLEGGRSVTKSMDRWVHGRCGMGNGCRRPEDNSLGVLDWAQT